MTDTSTLMPALVSNDPQWIKHGACRDSTHSPDVWFPLEPNCADAEAARIVYRTCPVQNACLNEALKNPEIVGIWGGLDEHQRRATLRRQARKARHG